MALEDAVVAKLTPKRIKYNEIISDKDYLDKILRNGAERAEEIASKTLDEVYRKIGLVRP